MLYFYSSLETAKRVLRIILVTKGFHDFAGCDQLFVSFCKSNSQCTITIFSTVTSRVRFFPFLDFLADFSVAYIY